eukprot:1157308-Pelagomonas_calceolata.AAC.10
MRKASSKQSRPCMSASQGWSSSPSKCYACMGSAMRSKDRGQWACDSDEEQLRMGIKPVNARGQHQWMVSAMRDSGHRWALEKQREKTCLS